MKKVPTAAMAQPSSASRIERDTMGELAVPATACYGVQIAHALENFPISSLRFPRAMIRALGRIKRAGATVNQSVGLLNKPTWRLTAASTPLYDFVIQEVPDEACACAGHSFAPLEPC